MAIGRISGPLLKNNLIRDGVNLAFETNLLYLDVVNSRIGINTAAPQYALDVVGTTRSTNLAVGNQLTVGNFTVSGNTVSSNLPTITFSASGGEATAYHSRLVVNDIELSGNKISTTSSNFNLSINSLFIYLLISDKTLLSYATSLPAYSPTASKELQLINL
jgi:hypothetical protein